MGHELPFGSPLVLPREQPAIFDTEGAVGHVLEALIMRGHDDADILFFHGLSQKIGDDGSVVRIEIGGGFIGEDNFGMVVKGPGQGDALFLSGRKIGRQVVKTMLKPEPFEHGDGSGACISRGLEKEISHQRDVFPGFQG